MQPVVEFQTVDVGRVEGVITIYDGEKFNVLFIGKIQLHGNRSVKICSAMDTANKVRTGRRKTILTTDGKLILVKDIVELHITNETAELVTFAIQPRN